MDSGSTCDLICALRNLREAVSRDTEINQDSADILAFRSTTAKLMARLILASPRLGTGTPAPKP
jgi:hypothetical protein